MPTHVKRTAEDKIDSGPAKKAKLDTKATEQELKERLAAKLDGPSDGLASINKANMKNLSDELNTEKLAAIRAKFIAQRRTRIKPEDEDAKSGSLGQFIESRGDTGPVFSRERQWRTRTTILQSTGKTFSKTITAILSSVKAREEGKVVKPPQQTPRPGAPPIVQPQQPQPRYIFKKSCDSFHSKIEFLGNSPTIIVTIRNSFLAKIKPTVSTSRQPEPFPV